jgi:hypothetical protein
MGSAGRRETGRGGDSAGDTVERSAVPGGRPAAMDWSQCLPRRTPMCFVDSVTAEAPALREVGGASVSDISYKKPTRD